MTTISTPTVPAAPPVTWIQIVTLGFAGVAALGAVIAAVVISIATARRERSAWVRQRQVTAYEAFYQTVWEAIDVVADGPVQTALDHQEMEGLDATRALLGPLSMKLSTSLHTLGVVGQPLTLAHAVNFQSWWGHLSQLAIPRKGSVHPTALQTRMDAIGRIGPLVNDLSFAMRLDQGIGVDSAWTAWRRKRKTLGVKRDEIAEFRAKEIVGPPKDHPLTDATLGAGREALALWRVRNWDSNLIDMDVGHVRVNEPWPALPLVHESLGVPMAAVLRDVPGVPFILAISAELSPWLIDVVEKDVARFVTGQGSTAWATLYGGDMWVVPNVSPEERVYWWPIDRLPSDPTAKSSETDGESQ